MSLPPLPGLIPISSFSLLNVKRKILRADGKEVMGEQRSHRINSETPDDLINNTRSSQAPQSEAQFTLDKSQRKHKQTSINKSIDPRVKPIFVWVKQEDNKIVDVKCEDYDKRNRIVLTKTPQGWRAMPKTEILAPNLKVAVTCEDANSEDEKPRRIKKGHHHRNRKVKQQSTGVQVATIECPSPEIEEMNPTFSLLAETQSESEKVEDTTNKPEVTSPLDNLLAVAELEFNQQIQEESNMKEQEIPLEVEVNKIVECDYNEEDDLVMNEILMHLEQSVDSPEAFCVEPEPVVNDDVEIVEIAEEEEEEDDEDDQPTDLSMPKAVNSRPASRCSTVIQSPQPSGLPPVPPSPDVNKNETKTSECEETITSSQPDKKSKNEDVTTCAMLSKDNEVNADPKPSNKSAPSRLLELLRAPETLSPLAQLKFLLTDANISVPDPLLIPKHRLNAILAAPAREIPELLIQRPELRLPEALKHIDLLTNPNILVITVHQLRTILQKQSQPAPDEGSSPKSPLESIGALSLTSLLAPTSVMAFLPYLQHLEYMAAADNPKYSKVIKYDQNFPNLDQLPFHVFPPTYPLHEFNQSYTSQTHKQFEYPIYQHQQFTPTSTNQCYVPDKPKSATPKYAPYVNPQPERSNLQVPQYHPTQQRNQKQQKSKVSQTSHSRAKNVPREKSSENAFQQNLPYPPQVPVDLSSVNNVMSKRSKYNQKLSYCDSVGGAKTNVRVDDTVPEVGSTTTSIDDFAALNMLEASKNVWHPYFARSNSSSSANSWNLPSSLTAINE